LISSSSSSSSSAATTSLTPCPRALGWLLSWLQSPCPV
jgi:hypothetical protein